MSPLEIARALGVDLSEDDPKILQALSTLSIHIESRLFKEFSGRPEVGMLLRVKCHTKAHAFYHGRELIITHVGGDRFFGFLTDTKKISDGTITAMDLFQFIGKASKEIWEIKYPELREHWGKDKL